MITKNIIILIGSIIIVGFIMFLFFNNESSQKKYKKNKKKVRFDNNISYKTYPVDEVISLEDDNYEKIWEKSFEPTNEIITPHVENDDSWDESFGIPLVNKKEKDDYSFKIMKNYKRFGNSLNNFMDYQFDDSTRIKQDIPIDPFKPSKFSYKNKPIREIYDEQVSGIKFIPKKIEMETKDEIFYNNESENNGGLLLGSNNLRGYDKNKDYVVSSFGNGF